jgi:protein TonB
MVARSQKEESFYVFDADWKPTKVKHAVYLLRIHQVNDTCWQWDYYNNLGPLIKVQRFRDQQGKLLHGLSYYYDAHGKIDSTGLYRNGRKNGEFLRFKGDSLRLVTTSIYREDSLIEVIYPAKQKKDSVVKYADEKESDYPGGVRTWKGYLNKNLRYPDRAVNFEIQGDVTIMFIVDKEGNVIDPIVAHSVEYSLDEESLRIISESGKWTPAFQNGKFVKSYKQQPIRFRLEKR